LPSPAEILRAQRAFYRVWLYSVILRDPFPRGHFGDVPADSRAFSLEADGEYGPFQNASDHCWLIEGWEFKEMIAIMEFLRERIVLKCWVYSFREENKANPFFFYGSGCKLSSHF